MSINLIYLPSEKLETRQFARHWIVRPAIRQPGITVQNIVDRCFWKVPCNVSRQQCPLHNAQSLTLHLQFVLHQLSGNKNESSGTQKQKGHSLRKRRITDMLSGDVFQNPPKRRQKSIAKQISQFPKDKLAHQDSRQASYTKYARLFCRIASFIANVTERYWNNIFVHFGLRPKWSRTIITSIVALSLVNIREVIA